MLFVAVGCETRGHGHDARVEDQGGEGRGLRQQGAAGGLHGAERGLVAGDEGNSYFGGDFVHTGDDARRGGCRAAGEEDV